MAQTAWQKVWGEVKREQEAQRKQQEQEAQQQAARSAGATSWKQAWDEVKKEQASADPAGSEPERTDKTLAGSAYVQNNTAAGAEGALPGSDLFIGPVSRDEKSEYESNQSNQEKVANEALSNVSQEDLESKAKELMERRATSNPTSRGVLVQSVAENQYRKAVEKAVEDEQERQRQEREEENREGIRKFLSDFGLDDNETLVTIMNQATGGESLRNQDKWYGKPAGGLTYILNRFANGGAETIGKTGLGVWSAIENAGRRVNDPTGNATESEDIKMLADYAASGGDISSYEAARDAILTSTGKKIKESAWAKYVFSEDSKKKQTELLQNLDPTIVGRIGGDAAASIANMWLWRGVGNTIDGMTGISGGSGGSGVISAIKNGKAAGLSGKEIAGDALKSLFSYNTSTALMATAAASDKATEWAKEYGDEPVKVFLNAAGTGLAEYVTENLFGDISKLDTYYTPDATGSFLKNVANEWPALLQGMLEEGAEEVINTPLEGLIDKATGDYDKKWFGIGDDAVFDLKDMSEAGITGAAAGGVMGFVSSSANAISQAKDVQTQASILNEYFDKLPAEIRPNHIDVNSAKTSADVIQQATGKMYEMLAEVCRIKGIDIQITEGGGLSFSSTGQSGTTVQDIVNDPAVQQILEEINTLTGHGPKVIYSDSFTENMPGTDAGVTASGADIATGTATNAQVISPEALQEKQSASANASSSVGSAGSIGSVAQTVGQVGQVTGQEATPSVAPGSVSTSGTTQAAAPGVSQGGVSGNEQTAPVSYGTGGLVRGADIETVSAQALKYARTGATVQETMSELVRSGLVTDVNALTQSEGAAIVGAWTQGNLDYKAAQKRKAGEVSVRGGRTGQKVSENSGAGIVQNAENAGATVENASKELNSGEDRGTIHHDLAVLDSYGVSDNGKRAFLQYKSSESYVINEKLRNGSELTEDDAQLVRGMDEALEKLPTYSGKTYREIKFDSDGEWQGFLAVVKEGALATFKSYTSSAKTKEAAFTITDAKHIVRMELESRFGRDASGLGIVEEQEIIFPRNTDFFVEIVSNAGNITNIKAREVVSNDSQSRGRGEESIHDESGNRVPTVQHVPESQPNGESGVADVQGVSGRDTEGHNTRVSRPHRGVSGGQRSTVRSGRSGTSGASSEKGRTEVLKPKAETSKTSVETAKRKLAQSEDKSLVKQLGKTAKAIYDRITGEGLSFSDVTLGKPPAGFNAAQQEQIVRALLNADESAGEATRVDLIGDGTFTFSNDAVVVSDMLARIGVKLAEGAGGTVRADINKAVNSLANPKTGRKMLGSYNGNSYVLVDGGAFLITDGEKATFESDGKAEAVEDGRAGQILQRFEKSIRENAVEISSVSGFTKDKARFARVKFSDGSAMTVKRAAFDALNKAGLTVLASPSAHGMLSLKDGVLSGLVLETRVDPVGDETAIKLRFDTESDEVNARPHLSGNQYSLSLFGKGKPRAGAVKSEVTETGADESSATEKQPESKAKDRKEARGESRAVSLTDVIDQIQRDFGVQITRGYMRDMPKKASGRYSTVEKGIRYRTANDISTVSHELGHALDGRYQILTEGTDLSVLKWFSGTLPAERAAAYRAAYGLTGNGAKDLLPLAKEGLADRLADYLTDSVKALEKYPKFKTYFVNQLSTADRARLNRIAGMVHEAVTNDDALLRGTVHTIEKPKATDSLIEGLRLAFREGTPEERKEYRASAATHKLDSFITLLFNKNQRLKRLGQLSESGSCEAYIDAQNATHNTGVVYSALIGDMTDLDGNVIGDGFHTILEGLTDEKGRLDPELYHEFGLYLDILHAAERAAQGHKIPQTIEKALADGTVERMEREHPDWPELSEKVYAYNNRLLDLAASYDTVDPKVVKKWRELYPHYVPMQRYFDEQTRKSRGEARATMTKGFANVNSPYKRAKGSQLDYYNPLDLIVQQTATVYQSAMHNHVMRSIVELVKDSPEPAILMEQIPDDLHITKISTDELVDRLTQRVKDGSEVEPEVADGMLQLLVEAMPEYLTQVETGTHADVSRRIVTVMNKGQKTMYKVNDPELFKAIVNLNPTRDTPVVRAISAVSRGVVQMWTSLNPLFSISNAARDLGTLTSSTLTELGGEMAAGKGERHISLQNRAALMAQMYKNIAKSYAQTVKERTNGLTATDPYHREYIAMGGNESGLADNARFMSVDVRKQFSRESARRSFAKRHKALGAVRQGWAVARYVSNMVERGPREAIYITAREMGVEPKLAYRLSQDTTTDFKNGGTLKGISAFIPLFNAGLAGSYRAGRHWTGEHITADFQIDPITSKSRQRRAAGRILASVILAIAGALLQTVLGKQDEDHYTQLSNYTKNNFYCIPVGDGKFIAIPKPREWAALQSVFERSAEAIFMDNEYALDGGDTYEYLTDMFLPNGLSAVAQGDLMGVLGTIAGVGPLFEIGANKDYLGRDIVPVSLQDMSPKYQYNEKTSILAWSLGQLFNVSPLQIDHVGRNWFGGAWEIMKSWTPNSLFREGDTSNVSTAIGNRWVRDASYSTDVINRMYDLRDKANVAKNDNEEDMEAAIRYKWYSGLTSFYSRYNKLAKEQPDSAQKRATRQTVLDMIDGSLESAEGKVVTYGKEQLEAYVERTGDTTVMPGVMNPYIKYGKNDANQQDLTADEYVQFQLLYNTYYWESVTELFELSDIGEFTDIALKKQLNKRRDRALERAKSDMLDIVWAKS